MTRSVISPAAVTTAFTPGVNAVDAAGPPWHIATSQGHRGDIAATAFSATTVAARELLGGGY